MDLKATPELGTYSSTYYNTDQLHWNTAGQDIAGTVSKNAILPLLS